MATTDPILTQMRQSVWRAIDRWPPLAGTFRRTLRFEDVGAMLPEGFIPAPGELPTLAILPSTATSQWRTNQGQVVPYVLDVTLWTKHLNVLPGEKLWQELLRAIWQSAPEGSTQPYVLAVCEEVVVAGPALLQVPAVPGSPAMCKWDWTIAVQKSWNPRTDPGSY